MGRCLQRTLGLRPENDVLGVMQDIHWSHGSFGYFPTYTLGNLYSALLWDAYCKDDPAAEEPSAPVSSSMSWAGCASTCTVRAPSTRARI